VWLGGRALACMVRPWVPPPAQQKEKKGEKKENI
jgi:hypothetical protein